ncbi:50S ribosomal L9 C-terminal domain-containing protein, partial [Mycoplasmopsis synoviae]
LEHEKRSKARELQKQIEELCLMFTLDAAIDKGQNLHVHVWVSTKELKAKLLEHKIKLHDHAIRHVHLKEEGTHVVEVSLYKDIKTKLRVNFHINVKK